VLGVEVKWCNSLRRKDQGIYKQQSGSNQAIHRKLHVDEMKLDWFEEGKEALKGIHMEKIVTFKSSNTIHSES